MPGYLFWFTLRKADGVDLGLQLCDTHAGALCIRHVWPYGAVHSWNKLCAGARPEVEIKASKQQNILKGNCEQKVDRNLVCRLDSAMTPSRRLHYNVLRLAMGHGLLQQGLQENNRRGMGLRR